jgi:hypothetical protein
MNIRWSCRWSCRAHFQITQGTYPTDLPYARNIGQLSLSGRWHHPGDASTEYSIVVLLEYGQLSSIGDRRRSFVGDDNNNGDAEVAHSTEMDRERRG